MRVLVPFASFASFVLAASMAPAAHAQECGAPLSMYQQRPLVAEIDLAPIRDAVSQRDWAKTAKAARAALKVKPIVRALERGEEIEDDAFGESEARGALAIAVVRSGGAQGLLASTTRAVQKKKNLTYAMKLLENELNVSGGDPVMSTYLGEAYASLGKTDAARDILEDLASTDLIVSPEGWAALAKVRAAKGDAELASAATSRCAAMSGDDGSCGATGTSGSTATSTAPSARVQRARAANAPNAAANAAPNAPANAPSKRSRS